MKRLKSLLIPAALLALAGLSGCNGQETRSSGMPVIDRWMSPGATMQPVPMMQPGETTPHGPIEYAEPPKTIPPSPVPAPTPPKEPSALLRPNSINSARLPNLREVNDPRRQTQQEIYFEDESGHTPLLTN